MTPSNGQQLPLLLDRVNVHERKQLREFPNEILHELLRTLADRVLGLLGDLVEVADLVPDHSDQVPTGAVVVLPMACYLSGLRLFQNVPTGDASLAPKAVAQSSVL